MNTEIRSIGEMNVNCSLKMRYLEDPVTAMSDCCGLPASSAVVMDNGNQMYRCVFHTAVRDYVTGEKGPYVSTVKVVVNE